MSDFYTRRGDDGTSGLLGKARVPKNHPQLEAVGAIDEANAALGMARATCNRPTTQDILLTCQRDLYGIMAEVAATPENAKRFRSIDSARVNWVEDQIRAISTQVEIPKEFIVPGDNLVGANLDFARAVVRRAERRVTQLFHAAQLPNPTLIQYLNRLSSLLFILELSENQFEQSTPITLAKIKK